MAVSTREVLHSQGSAEWYTPASIIELVRRVMGDIDLDPASCEQAQAVVQAKKYYTKEDNGLLHKWHGRVWLNAPGSQKRGVSGTAIWLRQLRTEMAAGRVTEAIQLFFKVSTETEWFHSVYGKYPICMIDGRIKFIPQAGVYENPDKNQPTQGNALVYFGSNELKFAEVFSEIGIVTPPFLRFPREMFYGGNHEL